MSMKYEPTQVELDAFIRRAGFTYGWENLESWARRMAEQACIDLREREAAKAGVTDEAVPIAWVYPRRYGNGVQFVQPIKPDEWDDENGEWYCRPLFYADALMLAAAPKRGEG